MAKTDLAFHFNASGKVAYTCKLVRKALAAGARVVVLGDPQTVARLDLELWTFSPVDFVPHRRAPCLPEDVARTPVLLCDRLEQAQAHSTQSFGVLVNLSATVPEGFDRFERVIEVVTQDDNDRQAARLRWKHYTELGYGITRHDLKSA